MDTRFSDKAVKQTSHFPLLFVGSRLSTLLQLEEEEEEEEPLLIYTTQGSPFRCKKLSVINGSPERNNVLKLCIHMHYTNTLYAYMLNL